MPGKQRRLSTPDGPVLRASGVDYDIRRAAQYSIYDRFDFNVITRPNGDLYDRYYVRLQEMRESVKILKQALRDDVRNGLTSSPKVLPPRWFYDARGSELFEEITRLPEYYPTRSERAILTQRAAEVASVTRAKTLVELGSGSSDKTRLLLDALTRTGDLGAFIPLDVSASRREKQSR